MELQISNTREELLLNTINHFNSDNRGLCGNGYSCTFINQETGNRCAIGRELKEELAIDLDEEYYSFRDIVNKLPERLKVMGIGFLICIQDLHDNKRFWNDDGLSDCGYDEVRWIISNFKLDLKI